MARTRGLLAAALLAAALVAAGCGGGIELAFGSDGDPPSVSLAASADSAAAGSAITLVAAASDFDGIDNVAFFRLDSNGDEVLLCRDSVSPYRCDTVVPSSGSSVRYFARARDGDGDESDSETVSVLITP